MFDLTLIIIMFAVMMVISVILFFISRVLFRIVTIATTIMLIVVLVIGVLVIQDAQRLNNELARGPTAYLLSDNGTVYAGFIVYQMDDDAVPLGSETINNITIGYLPMNSTNLFSVDILAFENRTLPPSTEFPDYLNMDNAISIILSQDPFETYANIKIIEDEDYNELDEEYARTIIMDELIRVYDGDETLLRSNLYMMMMSRKISKEGIGGSFIFVEAKKGNVELYPNRLTMRLIRVIPLSVLGDDDK
ncbi:MAG: hypothetical protein ACMXYL_05485 [Candidatus Woesearchaeota archaeon]